MAGPELARSLKLSLHKTSEGRTLWIVIRYYINYFIVFGATIAGFYLLSAEALDCYTSRSQTLQKLWQEDVKNLAFSNVLPPGIENLKEVTWETPDITTKIWHRYTNSPFKTKSTGEFRLEILALAQRDDSLVAVIQHHLIHIPSGNSVWELGRTYTLSEK